MVKTYEITYLIDPQLDENAREQVNADIEKIITDQSGNIVKTTPTLRRKLAYPIDDKHSAFLRVIFADIESEKAPQVETAIRKTEAVLRYTFLSQAVREDLGKEAVERVTQKAFEKKGNKSAPKRAAKKEVSMADVEKSIEDVLTEEVK